MPNQRYEDFTTLISNINRDINRVKTMRAVEYGVHGADIVYLLALFEHEGDRGMSSSELTSRAGVTRAMTARSVARLIKDGFVESMLPKGEKAYRVPLRLTKKGQRVAQSMQHDIDELMQQVEGLFSPSGRDAFYKSLRKVDQALQEMALPDALLWKSSRGVHSA